MGYIFINCWALYHIKLFIKYSEEFKVGLTRYYKNAVYVLLVWLCAMIDIILKTLTHMQNCINCKILLIVEIALILNIVRNLL